eukprot:731571-Pyramimonas_sp.AAC.1
MLILAGVRQGQMTNMAASGALAPEEVEVVRDPSSMVEALKKHWEPAFTASPVREDLIGPFLNRRMPEMDNTLLQIPTFDNLRF